MSVVCFHFLDSNLRGPESKMNHEKSACHPLRGFIMASHRQIDHEPPRDARSIPHYQSQSWTKAGAKRAEGRALLARVR